MSERTFRAVVAWVLMGALALAVLVTGVALLGRAPSSSPAPGPSVAASAAVVPSSAPAETGAPGSTRPAVPAFSVNVLGVGPIPRGGASATTLVLGFLESGRDAIPDAPGSFLLTLADHAGNGATVAFVGTPSVEAPDSLGAKARLLSVDVLQVSVSGSDPNNVELLTIRGLGISATPDAALGPVQARLGGYSGALVTTPAVTTVASPGTVTAGP